MLKNVHNFNKVGKRCRRSGRVNFVKIGNKIVNLDKVRTITRRFSGDEEAVEIAYSNGTSLYLPWKEIETQLFWEWMTTASFQFGDA
jgi:hypothetical protein